MPSRFLREDLIPQELVQMRVLIWRFFESFERLVILAVVLLGLGVTARSSGPISLHAPLEVRGVLSSTIKLADHARLVVRASENIIFGVLPSPKRARPH